MPRDLPVGNGNLLISFDKDYQLREFYFPHVGEENQTLGQPGRFGVWVDGHFSWIDRNWLIKMDYLDDSLVTHVELEKKPLRITANDLVDFHENIYLKKIIVENLSKEEKEVRLFFSNDFNILGNDIGDTAEFRPDVKGLLHYKGERYFLINAFSGSQYGLLSFATGNKEIGTEKGTWKDAEDGVLSKNPIAQGSVDSIFSVSLFLKPEARETFYTWIAAGKTWEEVKALNEQVKKKTPEGLFERTRNYWSLWVDKEALNYDLLPPKVARLYKRSLLIARTHINNCGTIIAGNDSDVVHFNRDTYSYMWPRDAALVAYAFDLAGYNLTANFFLLASKIIEKEGYFLHKYTPSGALASSWHPWMKEGKQQLPIQEDETALVIWALWKHYEIFRDIELVKTLYKPLIKRSADFMMNYRDLKTGLPLESYDLWEERQGVLTFTVSAVFGGLMAAANFAASFGEKSLAEEYRRGASSMRTALEKYLYLEKEKRFARMVSFKKDGSYEIDKTVDASLYGLFAFGAYLPEDEKVKNTMDQVIQKLWVQSNGGGLIRYENDSYYRDPNSQTSNPWFVTTLWLAQYHIALAKTKDELDKALPLLEWVADHALPSGVLAEQVNPTTHEPVSVSPLTWSHGTYIATVQEYLNKLLEIEKCPTCGLPKLAKQRRG